MASLTSKNTRVLHVSSVEDVRKKLKGGPAILLSAGVPYSRAPVHDATAEERALLERENRRFLAAAAPEDTIDAAVVLFAREILNRGMRLVFGAQPAVAETVLSIGSDFVRGTRGEPRILIFQSQFFEGQLPDSTLDLATWDAGLLVFTPEVTRREQPVEDRRRRQSLTRMRELMVSVPNLCAGVFIGGMDGVTEEATLFGQHNPDAPMFPIASTGSAARFIYEQAPARYPDVLAKASSPDDPVSYTLVADEICSRVMHSLGKSRRP